MAYRFVVVADPDRLIELHNQGFEPSGPVDAWCFDTEEDPSVLEASVILEQRHHNYADHWLIEIKSKKQASLFMMFWYEYSVMVHEG